MGGLARAAINPNATCPRRIGAAGPPGMASSNLWQPLLSELRRRGRDGTVAAVVSSDFQALRVGCCDRSCLLAPGGMSKPRAMAALIVDCQKISCARLRGRSRVRGGRAKPPVCVEMAYAGPESSRTGLLQCFCQKKKHQGPDPTLPWRLIPAACFENNDPVIALPPSLDFSPSLPTREQRPTSRDPASPQTSAPFRRAPRDRQSPRRRDELPRRERTRSPGSNT